MAAKMKPDRKPEPTRKTLTGAESRAATGRTSMTIDVTREQRLRYNHAAKLAGRKTLREWVISCLDAMPETARAAESFPDRPTEETR